MPTPVIVATPSAVNANSFGTRAEADSYHDTQLHPDAPWPSNVSASASLGSGINGTVTVTVDLAGTEGNSYTVAAVAGVGTNVALSANLVGTAITVTLGTNGAGSLDSTKNTALLVATVINNLSGVSASASGSGVVSIPVTSTQTFTGGSYLEEVKNPALIMAAQLMTSLIEWTGYVTTSTQILPWPRTSMMQRNGISWVDPSIIPPEVKYAQFEFARLLIASDRTVESEVESQGLSSLKVGPIDLKFSGEGDSPTIPELVSNLLVPSWVDTLRGQKSFTVELMRA